MTTLEERYIEGQAISMAMLKYVTANLESIRSNGHPLAFDPDPAAAEQINIDAELRARTPFALSQSVNPAPPRQVVCILGPPRSGTSHLYNLLARTRQFSYFTTATCWAWPARNLTVPHRRLFESVPEEVLRVDNKATRIIPALVMPYEAEDIYDRAVPTYRHLQGHTYDLRPAAIRDAHLLRYAITAHTDTFRREKFLTKSPFNAFRIHQLEQLFGQAMRYIHIQRPKEQVAASLTRNHFAFYARGRELSPPESYEVFTSAIRADAPRERTVSVTLEALRAEPDRTIAGLIEWLTLGVK